METRPGYHKFLAVLDTETTGLGYNQDDPSSDKNGGHYQMVSCGILIVDTTNHKIVDQLYVEIKWNGESLWNDKAEQVHGLSKQYLQENGMTEEEAAIAIGSLLYNHFGTSIVQCAGHNVSTFDIWFIRRLMRKFDIMFKTGNRFIDTHSIGYVCYNTYNSDDLFDLFIPSRSTHNSLDDAKAALAVIKNTRKLCNTMFQG